MRSSRGFVFTLTIGACIAVAAVMAGCGRSINRAAERRIRDALPDVLGPARDYRVHVSNPPLRTVEGRLAHVTVDADDVQLPHALLLDSLHLDLSDLAVDERRGRVQSIAAATFAATIRDVTLDELLAGESPAGEDIRDTRVTIGAGDLVSITARRMVLGVGIPFHLSGRLRIAGPTRVEFDPAGLDVVGIPVSAGPLHFILQRFQDAVDLSDLALPVRLTSVSTAPGSLTLAGAADVPAILARIQATPRPR